MKAHGDQRGRRPLRGLWLSLLVASAVLAGTTASGQVLDDLDSRVPSQRPMDQGDRTSGPEIDLPGVRSAAVEDARSFVLTGVVIEGVSAFPLQEFAPLYDPYLARSVSVPEMSAIAQAITDKYRAAGYFLSRAVIPVQDVHGGILRIEVYEGYVSALEFEGEAPAGLQKYYRSVLAETPLRLKTLERAISLTGDLNGVRPTGIRLDPVAGDLAAHKLVVAVSVKHLSGTLFMDNRGTRPVGRLETYASVSASSIISAGDKLSVGVFTIPNSTRELRYGEASYTMFVGRGGTYANLQVSKSNVEAGDYLEPYDFEVESTRGKFTLSHPILRKRNLGLWGNVEFDVRNVEQTILGTPRYEDRLRVVRGSVSYFQQHQGGITRVYARVSQGLDILNASNPMDGDAVSRPQADSTQTKGFAQVSRYQNLGRLFGLFVAAKGQYASRTLLTSENFALGGPEYGRAYDYWEISGEKGYAVQSELRFGLAPKPSWFNFFQLYAFTDYGAVWNERLDPPNRTTSLASAGGGVRLTLMGGLKANYEVGVPLSRIPAATHDKKPRHFFSLTVEF